jgi:hypothetical protein
MRTGAIALLTLLAGCFGNESTPFPPGLEPLEENRARRPTADGDPYPEVLALVSGDTGDYAWGHGRAFVKADLATTWAAIRTPEVCVDRRQVDEWTVVLDTEPEYDFSFRVHNLVDRLITVEFDVAWRHGAVDGTREAPVLTGGRWSKVEGSTTIEILRGSIVARAVAEGVTEVEFEEHIKALIGGTEHIESYLTDYFASIVAQAHGQPLPRYE